MENAIKNADRIIAVSENTKKDLIEILNINPEKIDVVYHGYNKPTGKINKNSEKYILLLAGEVFTKTSSFL